METNERGKEVSFVNCFFFIGWSEMALLSRDLMEAGGRICCYLGKSSEAGETTEANALRQEEACISSSSRKQGGQCGWSRRWERSGRILCC